LSPDLTFGLIGYLEAETQLLYGPGAAPVHNATLDALNALERVRDLYVWFEHGGPTPRPRQHQRPARGAPMKPTPSARVTLVCCRRWVTSGAGVARARHQGKPLLS
jgi:hypothetical protein